MDKKTTQKFKFVFFGNVVGPREQKKTSAQVLDMLIQCGCIPECIIQYGEESEVSKALYIDVPPINFVKLKNVCKVYDVSSYNSVKTSTIIESIQPDYILNVQGEILGSLILGLPKLGCINFHPGYLPDVKGSRPIVGAVLKDLPFGCSIHFMDEHIDTGEIILKKRIDPNLASDFSDLVQKHIDAFRELTVKLLKKIEDSYPKKVTSFPQENRGYVSKNVTLKDLEKAAKLFNGSFRKKL